jgi:uncharacterized phage protein (TIGR01671 family)
MRELKFRAWDKRQGKWCGYEDTGPVIDLYHSITNNCFMVDNDIYDFPPELVLCQYTGLKDKNGVEIYEGDIIKYVTQYYGKRQERQKVVEWIDDMQDDSFGEPLSMGYRFHGSEIEVIGNIYENPELLKSAA